MSIRSKGAKEKDYFCSSALAVPIVELLDKATLNPAQLCSPPSTIKSPYPPGISVLMPGEVITKSVLEYLQQIQVLRGFISGCNDISFKILKVLK